jgi:hypothetical protein
LSAVPDELVTTNNDNLRFNSLFSNIAFMYNKSNTDTYVPQRMQLSAPTIASNPIKYPTGIGVTWNAEANQMLLDFSNKTYSAIRPGDDVTSRGYELDQAGTAHYLSNVVIVTDQQNISYDIRNAPPLTHTAQATVSGSSTANEFTKYQLSLTDTLPAGVYAMSGASVLGSTCIAARFIFKTGSVSRPAVIPRTTTASGLHPFSRYWGGTRNFVFPDNVPQLEYISTTSEVPGLITLFLTKIG